MDPSHFDRLARAIAGPATRRGVLAGLLAAFGAAPAADAGPADKGKGKGKGKGGPVAEGPCGDGSGKANACTRAGQCCTGVCERPRPGKPKRCRCRRKGQPCAETRNCCQAAGQALVCDSGSLTCQPSPCDPACGACEACVRGRCEPANDGACCAGAERDGVCASGMCRDCGAGAPFCADGACAACRGSEGCGDGQSCCGGACVDPATDPANCGGCGTACGATQICAEGTCVTGIGTCPAGANVCTAPGFDSPCNGPSGCFCIPTRAGATRCATYYQTGQGFLRPCSANADCADLGPGAFCPPQFDSCGGVCSLPC